ncbi:hypothetical protein [Alteromonas facilis]|uniref:hypothetical protein n=1 Tax=Alteromonas facilis TaxID=2048004 RepID=UPI000F5C9493|nr:hypothetical protein [Alteromonas facilis]
MSIKQLTREQLCLMDDYWWACQASEKGPALKQLLNVKLIEHKRYIYKNDRDLPEIRDWQWISQ